MPMNRALRRSKLLLVPAVLLLHLTACGSNEAGHLAGASPRVLLVRDGEQAGLWLVRPDGSDEQFLTMGGAPDVASTGEVAYVKRPRGDDATVCVRDLVRENGGDREHCITRGIAVAWGPNAGELAVATREDVRIVSRSGHVLRRWELPGTLEVAWSPDGQSLAVAQLGNPIVVIDAATGEELFRTASEHDSQPAYDPRGRALVFVRSDRDAGGSAIMWRDLLSGRERELTPPEHLDSSPAVSGDGKHLVFARAPASGFDSLLASEIVIMDLQSGDVRQVTRNAVWDGSPTWFPAPIQ